MPVHPALSSPLKGAKHRVFMRQVSPLSPPWADWPVIGGHKRLILLNDNLTLERYWRKQANRQNRQNRLNLFRLALYSIADCIWPGSPRRRIYEPESQRTRFSIAK